MKFLIIGLGNFGASVATELTSMGHEVIAVDSDIVRVETFKDDITSTICMNCNDEHGLSNLPLKDTDVAIVCIGEDFGSSIMVAALLKKYKINRLICRATSTIHESVLKSIGVDDIVFPEQETALRLTQRLLLKGVVDSYQADEHHFIIKSYLPEAYDGLSIKEINFESYNLSILSVISTQKTENIFGEKINKYYVNTQKLSPDTKLTKDDLILVYGNKADIQRFFMV